MAMPRTGGYSRPLIFALICAELAAFISEIASVILSLILGSDVRFSRENGGLINAMVWSAVGRTVELFTLAAIVHLLVRLIVGPTNGGFEATFRVAASARYIRPRPSGRRQW